VVSSTATLLKVKSESAMAPTWRFPFAGAPAEEARDDAAGRGSDRFRRARFIPPASANNRGKIVAASAAAPLRLGWG